MKKFMKALALATVMCMLLSTVAFAADLTITDSKVSVTVNAGTDAANEQIAFVVSTATTAAGIATGNILDVQQVALDETGSKTIELSTGDATEATVYYGYKGVSEAQSLTAAAVVAPGETVVVNVVDILTDTEINEYAEANPDKEIVETETDKAGAVIAKVLVNAGDKTVTDMIWSIRHSGTYGVSYVKADASLFAALDGEVQIGLAFSNGNRKTENGIAEVEVTGLHAIVKLSDNSVIFSDKTFDEPNGPQAQN